MFGAPSGVSILDTPGTSTTLAHVEHGDAMRAAGTIALRAPRACRGACTWILDCRGFG